MNVKSSWNSPRVSVLMTVYNAEPYLREAIDSIVAQDFGDWELIAIENGSTDGSPAILRSYEDERIRPFFLPMNIGRTPALRYALEQAQGEYIAVLDADDVSCPERFSKQVARLDQHTDVGVVGSWVTQINSNGEEIGLFTPPTDENELYEVMGWTNPFVHSSIMYRSAQAKQLGGYPEEYVYAQDFALILALSKISRLDMIGECLCKYRIVGTSMTQKPQMLLIIGTEQLALLRAVAKSLTLSALATKRNRQRQAVAQLKIGLALVRQKNFVKGLKSIVSAIAKDPRSLVLNGMVSKIFMHTEAKE